MNTLVSDYKNNTQKKSACKYIPDIKKKIENNFDNNLYKDIGDIYGKNSSQRQFYTMPNTQIPNDRKQFANWLYNNK